MQNFIYMTNQWHRITAGQTDQNLYVHKHTQDLCQIRSMERLNMRQIDQYSSRQFYSYPYCPKIYKSATGISNFTNQQILFDLFVVVEHVPLRLGHQECKIEEGKLVDLVKGFIFLLRRYGPFKPSQKMIGCTQQGLVKVWFNQDFCSNIVSHKLQTQKEMTESIIQILKRNALIDKNKIITDEKLSGLLESLKRKVKTSKQVNFEEIKQIKVEETSEDVSKQFKKYQNLQSGFKQRKLKKCQTFCQRQVENVNPFNFSLSPISSKAKYNTTLFQNDQSHCKNALNFLENAQVKHQIIKPKFSLNTTQTHSKNLTTKTLNNHQYQENKRSNEYTNIKYTRSTKKCLTNFDINCRILKQTQQSLSRMSDFGSNDFLLNSPSKNRCTSITFLSSPAKQVLARPQSEYKKSEAQKQKDMEMVQQQIKHFWTGKSEKGMKQKSLQQALKEDVDALFASESKLHEVDSNELTKQLDQLLG